MSEQVKQLLSQVQKTKIYIQNENFEEKQTAKFAPYTNAKEVPRLERFWFEKNAILTIYSVAFLRDQYCLLISTNGILRGESLFKCELSDMCDLVHIDR